MAIPSNKVLCAPTTMSIVDLDPHLLGSVCDKMFESMVHDGGLTNNVKYTTCGLKYYARLGKIAMVSHQFKSILNEYCVYFRTDDVFEAVKACTTVIDIDNILFDSNEKARARKDIAMMSVKIFPTSLLCFNDVVKDDYLVAMAAVEALAVEALRHPEALERIHNILGYCNAPAKESKELAMLCVKLDPETLPFFSTALKNDYDVIRAAMSINPFALIPSIPELRDTPGFIALYNRALADHFCDQPPSREQLVRALSIFSSVVRTPIATGADATPPSP